MNQARQIYLILSILFILTVLPACAHKLVAPTDRGTGLFPYGTYQHNVKIHIMTPERFLEMQGVVNYSHGQLKVVGLSTFNTTVFRIEERLDTGEIKKEFYLDIVKRNEDRFMKLYHLIRGLITANKDQTDFTKDGARFLVSELDANGIYRKVHIDHEQFTLDIDVAGYQWQQSSGAESP
jgi:hypothetical protein